MAWDLIGRMRECPRISQARCVVKMNEMGHLHSANANVRVLLLPGWLNPDSEHWQSHWERSHGWQLVMQDDWHWPRRGDWMARLEDALLSDEQRPAVLAAHGLGCHLVAAWAAHSQNAASVVGALLVAPPDTERADMPPQLFNWRPVLRQRLPFPAQLLFSRNDPFCSADRALALAADWGAVAADLGALGHSCAACRPGAWDDAANRVRFMASGASAHLIVNQQKANP